MSFTYMLSSDTYLSLATISISLALTLEGYFHIIIRELVVPAHFVIDLSGEQPERKGGEEVDIGGQGQRETRIRPSVFISSTSKDLIPYREKVILTLLAIGLFPVAMEQFGANSNDAVTVSLDKLAESDVYLGIIAWRYGTVPDNEARSVTHLEYLAARKRGMPCYLFLADPQTQQDATYFPADLRDPEHRDQLLDFRAQIQKDLVADYFTTPDELAREITVPLQGYLLKRERDYQRQLEREAQQRRPNEQNGLLRRVDDAWISGALAKSLAGATFIPLGLYERPNLVESPWKTILQDVGRPEGPLPTGTAVSQVYDDTPDVLLLLGEPGAGKSTLLLQLARVLLERAKQDTSQPMPAVFPLSTWALKRQPLTAWLIDEMNTRYGIARSDGKAWIEAGQVVPLLDGLDEVAAEHRAACVHAINAFLQTHHLTPLVIGSRMREYEALPVHISGGRAVQVQPLTVEQIHAYLASGGEALGPLQELVRTDPAFAELAQNPLMLSILIRTYREGNVRLNPNVSQDQQWQQIFQDYVKGQLRPAPGEMSYPPPQTKGWLKWLAGQLHQREQTTFLIERMQMDWLSKTVAYRLYFTLAFGLLSLCFTVPYATILFQSWSVGAILGLETAGMFALFGWLIENGILGNEKWDTSPEVAQKLQQRSALSRIVRTIRWKNLIFALFVGVLTGTLVQLIAGPLYSGGAGLIFGAFFLLLSGMKKEIQPAELLIWSWRSVRKNALASIFFGTSVGTLLGLNNAIPYYQQPGVFLATLGYGMSEGISIGLLLMLVRGYAKDTLKEKMVIKPNQGIKNSLSNSLRLGLISSLSVGCVIYLFYGFVLHSFLRPGFASDIPSNSDVIFSTSFALGIFYLFWLINGGFAVLQHYVLRFVLWRRRSIPARYIHFLDYADKHILLRKIGGGYQFIHKRFLDYFAILTLDEDDRPTPQGGIT
jgi:energy-coupling factor transporter ATP-binding protein EcfA2